MVAQEPELAGLDVGLLRQFGCLVGVGQTGLGQIAGQVGQECCETRVVDGERRQQLVEDRLLGDRHCGDGIQRRENERLLLLGQLDVEDGHCGLAPGERLLDSGMAVDDMAGGGVDHHLGHPADGIEGAPQSCSLLGRMAAPVAGVGQELARVLRSGADDPGAPGCGGAHRSDPKVTKTAKPGCTHTRRAARSTGIAKRALLAEYISRGNGAARSSHRQTGFRGSASRPRRAAPGPAARYPTRRAFAPHGRPQGLTAQRDAHADLTCAAATHSSRPSIGMRRLLTRVQLLSGAL